MRTHRVGIAGLGVVGLGVARILSANREAIRHRTGVEIVAAKAAERDSERAGEARDCVGQVIEEAMDLLADEELETVVEVIGGTGFAREFALAALEAGKNLVTANKALLAEHGTELERAARRSGVSLGYEASAAGGIPIVRTLRDAFAGDNVRRLVGILNGTCNYILTKMSREGQDFASALADAQREGFAESDPALDISGADSAHKLAILARLAFGSQFRLEDVYVEGIEGLDPREIEYAAELGYRVKLLAVARRRRDSAELRVHPCLVESSHPLASVEEEFNSIYLEGEYVGPTMLYGRGAGRWPTAGAVVADLIDVATGRAACAEPADEGENLPVRPVGEVEARYYIRFQAVDRPGVLAGIAGILGSHEISIAQAIQKGRSEAHSVPLVLVTHTARESAVQAALDEVEKLETVRGRPVILREEGRE